MNLALIIACARAPVIPDETPPTCSSDAFSQCGPVLNQSAIGAGSLETGCAKCAHSEDEQKVSGQDDFSACGGTFFFSYVQKCCSKQEKMS